MQVARIAELLKPFLAQAHSEARSAEESAVLSDTQLHNISTYIDILQRWNTRINLTSIRSEEEIVTRHFGESFFAACHLFPHPAARYGKCSPHDRPESPEHAAENFDRPHNRGRAALPGPRQTSEEHQGASAPAVADVGSGAGFPGIPMKLWAPQIHLTLIESNHKKATFLREVVRALILTDINIQTVRAETIEQKFDVVTLRAVERFGQILPVAANLVAPAGRLTLLIGSAQVPHAGSALPSMTWSAPKPVPNSRSRVLLVGSKVPAVTQRTGTKTVTSGKVNLN